jgi:hypothetical protein
LLTELLVHGVHTAVPVDVAMLFTTHGEQAA